MQNIQASNLIRMLLFVMVVVNIYSNWLRKTKILRSNVESQAKVTRKVIKCKKIKCHNFKDFPQVIYTPNQNHRGSKYQSDVQNPRGICFYPYYHNDLR